MLSILIWNPEDNYWIPDVDIRQAHIGSRMTNGKCGMTTCFAIQSLIVYNETNVKERIIAQ